MRTPATLTLTSVKAAYIAHYIVSDQDIIMYNNQTPLQHIDPPEHVTRLLRKIPKHIRPAVVYYLSLIERIDFVD